MDIVVGAGAFVVVEVGVYDVVGVGACIVVEDL